MQFDDPSEATSGDTLDKLSIGIDAERAFGPRAHPRNSVAVQRIRRHRHRVSAANPTNAEIPPSLSAERDLVTILESYSRTVVCGPVGI
ncbi:hypothetical protein ACFCZ1_11910 [Streptomyces sp. NPDC056224]|uniref:hypothetical protein n=1 Tax=Streptomyces sp. NPDC056224 TaxID=3345750 RepID=UPI0035DB3613